MFIKTFESASVVLEQAKNIARATDRNILIHFFADWCHYCHYLEASLEACPVKLVLQKYFVITTLIEDGDENGENEGAWEMRRDFGGASCGTPFMVIVNAEGEKIGDSKDRQGRRGNIGCPYTTAEIATFGNMLQSSSPRMTDAECDQVLDYFRNAPWRQASIRG